MLFTGIKVNILNMSNIKRYLLSQVSHKSIVMNYSHKTKEDSFIMFLIAFISPVICIDSLLH